MEVDVRPQWVEKMYPGKVGRDHLGLGSVSSLQILPELSPGINVLTFQPRYYSFYIFLLDEFWRSGDRIYTTNAWKEFYRPREFVYSVAACLHNEISPECANTGKIMGSQKNAGLARQHFSEYCYSDHQDFIKSDFGGYGLYYRTVMAELGLLYLGGTGANKGKLKIDKPTLEGEAVAASFREAIKDTEYYKSYFNNDNAKVPLDVIQEFAEQTCLCQLKKSHAPDRPILLKTFLYGGLEKAAEARRKTFQLFLDIVDQTDGTAIDDDLFRQLLYFQGVQLGTGKLLYSPSDNIIDIYRKWRMLQLREYFTFALNALWYHFCEWGLDNNGDMHPLSLTAFWEYVSYSVNYDNLARKLGISEPGLGAFSDFTDLAGWLKVHSGAGEDAYEQRYQFDTPIQEHLLYQLAKDNSDNPDATLTGMIAIIALIYLRFGSLATSSDAPDEWRLSQMRDHSGLGITVHGFLMALQQKIHAIHPTIQDVIKWIYLQYIIPQHHHVATGKLPDNTFRFRRQGGLIRFYNLRNELTFMDVRFGSISTVVFELGLCGFLGNNNHPLTSDGQELLAKGDINWIR